MRPRPIDQIPPAHILGIAVGAATILPAVLTLIAVERWFSAHLPMDITGVVFVIGVVTIVTLPLTVPLALAALASYWRRVPPSRQRATWTTVVLLLLAPSFGLAGRIAWVLLTR